MLCPQHQSTQPSGVAKHLVEGRHHKVSWVGGQVKVMGGQVGGSIQKHQGALRP